MSFKKSFQSIWADLDPNGHMRHTAYNDYAAQLRLNYFDEHGFSFARLIEMGIGPILFREETRFLREVRMNEVITVDFALRKARKDASKWTIRHQVFKDDGQLSASIEVDGAWLDLHKRKVIMPPQEIITVMLEAPKTEDFEWLPPKNESR